jgi:kynurenine formamidase
VHGDIGREPSAVSRARLARTVLLLAAIAAAPFGAARAAKLFSLSLEDVANGRAQVVDLTHDLMDGLPVIPGQVPFTLEPLSALADGSYMNAFSCGEHTGTHLDAPAHLGKGLPTVDEIAPVRLVSQGISIDVRARVAANPAYALTMPDLLEWEKANGKIPPRSLVILNTGWHQRWENPDRYVNRDENGVPRFPGFAPDAVRALIKDRDVNGLGIDTASIDPGGSTVPEGHKAVLLAGRYHVENLDNLDLLPARGFTVIVAPLKISRGSGAPVRVLAIIPR